MYIVHKLGYNFGETAKQAKIVDDFIHMNNLKNVILVGHSKGGLIGKYLLVYHNSEKRILGVISIATPYHGSFSAKHIPLQHSKELVVGSAMIEDLQRHTEVNKQIISLTPSFDNHIWKEENRNLTNAENIRLDIKGHNRIVFHDKTVTHVLKAIEKLTLKSK